jgi:hypothetical protein
MFSKENSTMKTIVERILIVCLFCCLSPLVSFSQIQTLEVNRGFVTIVEITERSCLMCHEWAASHEGLTDPVRYTPNKPEQSPLYTTVADGSMPPMEPKLTAAEEELLYLWVLAGAPISDTPLSRVAPPSEPAPQESTAEETKPGTYLGFSSKVRFHQVAGFTSGSLLLAAGVVGTVQWATFISEGHDYRDANDIEEDEIGSLCADKISDMWSSPLHQSLRWTHVGLLATGELLYLANAATGIGMLSKDRPGLTPQDLHRYAFFTHGALMLVEIVMGFLTTEMLKDGSHEMIQAFGIAHSAIGLTIPIVIISSGIAVNRGFPRPSSQPRQGSP